MTISHFSFPLSLIGIIFLSSFQNGISQNQNSLNYSSVWVADNGDGTYKNPILHADYSDPDVVRVGSDYYMTSSSFNCVPGLPILHSTDLVNWKLINHALPKQPPFDVFDKPQHGNGVWAPCIRYHNDEVYIFYPDPDYGIYMTKTKDPAGDWSEPVLIKPGKGIIDPAPLWDDDGKAYLAYAYAGSRAGIKSILVISTMNEEGTKVHDDEVMIIDGHGDEPTIEGPKFYKRNGYYYIFAPAGGVPTGWQTILRSKNIYGPYEKKNALDQGTTEINGPHQGAWVNTQNGEDWFFHFQDKDAYGRIVHLQPMKWVDDWPVMGVDPDDDGTGEPVMTYKKPMIKGASEILTPPESDEFNEPELGLQWQWHANPEIYWGFPTSMGYYALFCRPKPEGFQNLYDVPNLLLQKFPAEEFTATTKMTFHARYDFEQTGLLIMGRGYSYIRFMKENGQLQLAQVICNDADKNGQEKVGQIIPVQDSTIYLRAKISEGAVCTFSYSKNGVDYTSIGQPFNVREGKWIGAKIGFLALREDVINDAGNAEIDWFRISK